MKRFPFSYFSYAGLLVLLMGTLVLCADSTKTKRSVVIKDPPPDGIYYKVDRSNEELWDSFMLVKKANSGDATAQHELGLCYLMGEHFFADTQKAVVWIQKAADQHLAEAQYNYSILLNNGIGVAWNPFEAYKYLHSAAVQGMLQAEYVLGLFYTDNLTVARNYAEAYKWLSRAADSGYAPAKTVCAEIRKLGVLSSSATDENQDVSRSTPSTRNDTAQTSAYLPIFINFSSDSVPDPDTRTLVKEAMRVHETHSEEVDSTADDSTVEQEPDSAQMKTILEDAAVGSPEALTLLGWWYQHGLVMKKDETLAAVSYLSAVRCGARWAPKLLWKLVKEEKFFERLRERINRNDPRAMYVWAELIASGFDAQITEAQALQLLSEASKQDFTEATVELGMRYYTGKWVPTDREKGKALLQQAAQSGNTEAKIRLWMIALEQERKDRSASYPDSLRALGDRGSVLAHAMLGYCYEKGIGVASNIPQSVYFYREAARRGNQTAYDALKELYAGLRPDDPEFEIGE